MKKLLTLTACLMGGLVGMAQGEVQFANGTATLVRFASTPDVPAALRGLPAGSAGGPALASWHVALYWQNGNTFSQLGAAGGFNAGPGRFIAGVRGKNGVVPSLETFKVVAWSGSAPTYEDALGSGDASVYAGSTAAFQNYTGSDPGPAPALYGFTGLTVAPVPEPSLVSLALFGAVALALTTWGGRSSITTNG